MFDNLVLWFSGTDFYLKYVSQWPAPLNNVSFDAALLVVGLIMMVAAVYEAFENFKFRQRIKLKQQRNREAELDREIKEREREAREQERYEREREENKAKRESDELMNQYLKFMMIAQMQNVSSCLGISFDQFKDMKLKVEQKDEQKEAQKPEVRVEEPEVSEGEPQVSVGEKIVEKVVEVEKIVVDDSLAYVDELTQLGNRRAYNRALKDVVASCMGVIYFDINNLKTINDTMGHSAGDKMITTVAGILKQLFNDCVYRIGGDEFVVLLNSKDEKKIADFITTFKNKIADLNMEATDGICYDTACGYCVSKKGLSVEDIQRIAEERMYADKQEMKALLEVEDEVEPEVDVYEEVVEDEGLVKEETEEIIESPVESTEDEEELDIIESPLVDVEDEPTEEIVEEEIIAEPVPEVMPEVPEPEEDVINIEEILAEKAAETKPTDDVVMSDFERLLGQLQSNQENESKFKQANEEKARTKEKNAQALESQVKQGLKVDGDDGKHKEKRVQDQDTEDFKQRKDKVLKQEEKERIKAEKLAEKERKKAEKAAEREQKKANRKAKKNIGEKDEDMENEEE